MPILGCQYWVMEQFGIAEAKVCYISYCIINHSQNIKGGQEWVSGHYPIIHYLLSYLLSDSACLKLMSDPVKAVLGLYCCHVVRACVENLLDQFSCKFGKLIQFLFSIFLFWLKFCEQPAKPMSIQSQITVDWKFVDFDLWCFGDMIPTWHFWDCGRVKSEFSVPHSLGFPVWQESQLVSVLITHPSRQFWDRHRWKSGLSIVIWDCGWWKSGPCLLGF